MEADSPAAEGRTSEGEASGDSSEGKQESRDEMLTRHRREIAGLQNKELALKKAAAKGSKAEQKAKKKQVEDEMIGLSSRLKAKHSEELASLGYKNTDNTNEKGNLDNLVKAIAGVTVTNGGNSHGYSSSSSSKPSKGAKRRERRAQEEAAREQRIQEEQSNIVSDRMIENKKLEEKLVPLGLTVNEIKPDGHCLYRAVEDQLLLQLSLNNEDRKAARYSYLELRKMAADYMREHAADLLPFFLSSDKVEVDSDECDSELLDRFKEYCEEVESTAAWGGQLELGALSHCLKKHIMIYSGSYPDVVEMGREYFYDSDSAAGGGGGGGSASRHGSIMLSYHMHAYGLGEHYNSVVPNLSNR